MNIEEITETLDKEIGHSLRFSRNQLLTGYLTVDQAKFLIKYIEQARDELARRECVWTEQYDFDAVYWSASCGGDFIMDADTPIENGYKYCPHCGGEIKQLETPK